MSETVTVPPITILGFQEFSGIWNGQSVGETTRVKRETYRGFRTTNKTPGYGKFSSEQKAALAPLPMEAFEERVLFNYGISRTTDLVNSNPSRYSDYTIVGCQDGLDCQTAGASIAFLQSDLDAAINKNTIKLLNKIKGTNINLAVAYAERTKTMDLLVSTALNIAHCYSELRKGDFVKAASHLGLSPGARARGRFKKNYAKDRTKAAATGWLQLQYGWKPLLSDIYGAAVELSFREQIVKPLVCVAQTSVPVDSMRSVKITGGSITVTEKRTLTVRSSASFQRKPGAQQDLPRLGITNPALVAWELVPYSFVVDWFLPIGGWLETLDAPLGIDFGFGYQSVKQESHVSTKRVQESISSGQRNTSIWSSSTYHRHFTRTVFQSLPAASMPSFKNPMSVSHMASALALLSNVFTRKR